MISYPFFEIPSDSQHDLLSETILFGGDVHRSRLGGGLDYPHIFLVGGASIKYTLISVGLSRSLVQQVVDVVA